MFPDLRDRRNIISASFDTKILSEAAAIFLNPYNIEKKAWVHALWYIKIARFTIRLYAYLANTRGMYEYTKDLKAYMSLRLLSCNGYVRTVILRT